MSNHVIAVRGYAREKKSRTRHFSSGNDIGSSDRLLVLNTETTVDAAQRLKFGCFLYYERGQQIFGGLFYEPAALTTPERKLLKLYSKKRYLELLTRKQLVEKVFLPHVSGLDAVCAGFDLPFNLSRLAIAHAPSKTLDDAFSFALAPGKYVPRLQMKHLSSRSAIIQFATPAQPTMSQAARAQGLPSFHSRGYFVDVKTLASALLSDSWSLESLSKHLDVSCREESRRARQVLTRARLASGMRKVQTIFECFQILNQRYESFSLTQTPINRIYSEASIGKAYLRQMGIKPWMEKQSDFPPELLGIIMSSYFGGRAEVHIRRRLTRVLYCDFLSMYPTVCTLMNLWRFVIAQRMDWEDTTEQVRGFLEEVRLEDLQNSAIWKKLTVLVQVEPEDDLLLVRTKYNGLHYSIGLNYLESKWPLWYTLADCLASTLLTGRPPKVVKALRFAPGALQPCLSPINVAGKREYRVDPVKDDFYQRLIELRTETKATAAKASTHERDRLETEQTALKICASATSYGIFVELNTKDHDRGKEVICYGSDGNSFTSSVKTTEEPGPYFHPLLASLITGAARLMLAIAERLAGDTGITWAFCDTDSMALAKPEVMTEEEFLRRARSIQEWFTRLNPYRIKGPLLKIEDVNYAYEEGELTDRIARLYCWAVSAKRYALFNLGENGRPVIRKASAHGLGHLLPPYDEPEPQGTIPAPVVSLEKIGVERWQYDLWYQIVVAGLSERPRQIRLNCLDAFNQPAVSSYTATTPRLLKWFSTYNEHKPYAEQVKPFNFLLAYQSKSHLKWTMKSRDTTKVVELLPVAPYDRDPEKALLKCFDRITGERVEKDLIKTYAEVLNQYHLHPEAKFHRGDYIDAGFTARKHVSVLAVEHVGKEANRLEEQQYLGRDEEALIRYDPAGHSEFDYIEEACRRLGFQPVAKASRLSPGHLRRLVKGGVYSSRLLAKLLSGISILEENAEGLTEA